MTKYLFFVIAIAVAGQARAGEEFTQATGGVVVKSYPGVETESFSYEVGKSTITLTKDCLDGEHGGDEAINAKQAQIEQLVKGDIEALKLKDSPEKLGYDFSQKIQPSSGSPVEETLNDGKKQYFWKNRCTGEETDIKPTVDDVYSASKTITVWFPNKADTLSQLTKLVKKIEALSDKNVLVKCNSAQGENFDLALTPTTEKEAWTKIKETAKARALDAMNADIKAIGGYDNEWEDLSRPIAERAEPGVFSKNGYVQLPSAEVVLEDGEWIAKFSSTKPFTVLYKQMDIRRNGDSDVISDRKTYNITTKSTTKKNLYATLSVAIRKDCFDDKLAAEAEVGQVAKEVKDDFAALYKLVRGDGAPTSTDRKYFKDAVGRSYSPYAKYKHIKGDATVEYFYNTCKPSERVELTEEPKAKKFFGQAVYKIKSSNLTELSKLKEKYEAKYKAKSNDPAAVKATVAWSATATVPELVALSAQFEVEAVKKFLAPNSEYRCEEGNFSVACLTDMQQRAYYASAPVAPQMPSGAYSEAKAKNDIDESERGEKPLTGTYTITKTWRKVLRNTTPKK